MSPEKLQNASSDIIQQPDWTNYIFLDHFCSSQILIDKHNTIFFYLTHTHTHTGPLEFSPTFFLIAWFSLELLDLQKHFTFLYCGPLIYVQVNFVSLPLGKNTN